jgi:hypothetical protein
LGISIHPTKSHLEPSSLLTYLGFTLDIPRQLFLLSDKQKEKITNKVPAFLAYAQHQ